MSSSCFQEPDVAATTEGGSSGSTGSVSDGSDGPSASSTTSEPGSTTSGDVVDGSTADTAGEDSDSSSSEGSSESTTGGEVLGPYRDCYPGPISEGMKACADSCVISEPDHSACAPVCNGSCEDGPDGFGATCLTDVADGIVAPVCFVQCFGVDDACPAGMECMVLGSYTTGGEDLWGCLWP